MELLVTLTIISILIALGTKGVQNAVGLSQASKCASNLRQIGIAARAWSADNDGTFVPYSGITGEDAYNGTNNWTGFLAPYMGQRITGVFTSARQLPAAICPLHPNRFGYGQNLKLSPWTTGPSSSYVAMVKLARVSDVANVVYFTDNTTGNLADVWGKGVWRPFTLPPSFGQSTSYPYFGHVNGSANFLWADGHVTAEKATSASMNANDKYWTP